MSATMVGQQRNCLDSDDVKSQNNVRNFKFLVKYFYKYFQIFPIVIYNENLPMKSYNFFQIYKRFDRKSEKTLIDKSMRKKTVKNWTFSYSRLFYTDLWNDSLLFFTLQAHSQRSFCFFISGWRKQYQKGKLKRENSWEWSTTIFVSKIVSIF